MRHPSLQLLRCADEFKLMLCTHRSQTRSTYLALKENGSCWLWLYLLALLSLALTSMFSSCLGCGSTSYFAPAICICCFSCSSRNNSWIERVDADGIATQTFIKGKKIWTISLSGFFSNVTDKTHRPLPRRYVMTIKKFLTHVIEICPFRE